jgi:hypothetical protein
MLSFLSSSERGYYLNEPKVVPEYRPLDCVFLYSGPASVNSNAYHIKVKFSHIRLLNRAHQPGFSHTEPVFFAYPANPHSGLGVGHRTGKPCTCNNPKLQLPSRVLWPGDTPVEWHVLDTWAPASPLPHRFWTEIPSSPAASSDGLIPRGTFLTCQLVTVSLN